MHAASALRAQAPSDDDLGLPVPVATVGGLPIAVINRVDCARLMVDLATARRNKGRPALVFTSANGQVVSMCEASNDIRALFLACDLINADGMPLVFASQWLSDRKLPERVATTDLVYEAAKIAQERGASFYFLGAAADVIEQAVEHLRRLYPRLDIVGYRHGYFSAEEEADVVAAINAVRPDILWLGLGVPAEQRFALRHREHLCGVGVIKTSGGLFDFLSGKNRRAPEWMQAAGLEWAFRTYLEPQRLLGRYMRTNPHALFLLLTKTRSAKPEAKRSDGS
jgi:N-acetylglucosaminyldiphosphoundecaprenol N-acetyl-beta-D-mannosaminyltransferase